MLNEFIRNNLRRITVITIIVIIALIGFAIYTNISHSGKVAVTVSIVPGDAHVTLNGNTIASGTIYVPIGSYTVKATKTGYDDYTQKQYIDQSKDTILVTMAPQSDSAKKEVQNNQNQYLQNESLGGVAADKEGAAFLDKNPITGALPYENFLYTIGYMTDSSDPSGNSIILTITATQGYRNAAVEQIRTFGYDPASFKIKFNDYTNPFTS